MVELELLTDGLESERWSVCVCVCVCVGVQRTFTKTGSPGAVTLGHVFVVCVDWGRETSFFLLSLGELFDFLKTE